MMAIKAAIAAKGEGAIAAMSCSSPNRRMAPTRRPRP